MNYRDFIQKIIYYLINPLIRGMIKVGITPNIVTFIGFLGNMAAAGMFIYAATLTGGRYAWIGYGGWVLIASSLFDMMDGRLARLGNMSSTFGAFWDSTLDRYSELVSLGGIVGFYFGLEGETWGLDNTVWGILTLAAMIGSVMVSYVRARAEGLGLDCKVGIMQRPERVVVLCLGAIVAGFIDNGIPVCVAILIIAVLSNITAFWRIAHVYKQLK
ncbi:MAG: CDP-alcohol phosphatidyltransferase family protein [Prevotella sp.]